MEDIIKSIKATLYDRAASPLVGSFVLAWLVWNYDFVLAFFSGAELSYKLDYIQTYIFGNWIQCLGKGFIGPAVTVYIYYWWIHKLSIIVYKKAVTNNRELIDEKRKLEKEALLSVEQSNQLRRQIENIQNQTNLSNSEREEKIKALSKQLGESIKREQEFESKISQLNEKLLASTNNPLKNVKSSSSAEPVLIEGMEPVLLIISETGNVDAFNIFQQLKKRGIESSQTRCMHYAEEMEEMGLVEKDDYGRFNVTSKGRKYIVENNLDFTNKIKDDLPLYEETPF